MKDSVGTEHAVSAVIIETKHSELDSSAIAQVMGYYCKTKKGNNQAGFAMLLNEVDKKVEARFFLFPYKANNDNGYCIQSLMLPLFTCSHDQLIQEPILFRLILLTFSPIFT